MILNDSTELDVLVSLKYAIWVIFVRAMGLTKFFRLRGFLKAKCADGSFAKSGSPSIGSPSRRLSKSHFPNELPGVPSVSIDV